MVKKNKSLIKDFVEISKYFGQRFDLTQAAGGNSSNIHVDWMIGSGELDIDGITQGGDRVPVMRSGEWAYE